MLVQGASEVEAIENIRIAIEEYLEVVAERIADSEIREVEVAVRARLNCPRC